MSFYSELTFRSFFDALVRKKNIGGIDLSNTRLDRCLSTFSLTLLSVGSTLGLGIHVLAGQVASTKAGPAVLISFVVAAIASIFAAFCYAEFGARVPKAGSAYVYSYITVGELMGFIIGWNLVLEYLIGTASVARGYSGYIDSLFNGTIESHLKDWIPIGVSNLSSYPDFLAFAITFLLAVLLVFGVKESTRFNTVVTCMDLVTVSFIIICGFFYVNIKNWNLSAEDVKNADSNVPVAERGSGGFFPFGFSGVMSGAATCFYGFVGFDIIATTGEEAKNPAKSIPRAIMFSLTIIFLAYFSVSTVTTLMWPYYDQNREAPIPYVFGEVGDYISKWIISIGALSGMTTCILGSMLPLPRVLYAMASDGLIFRSLSNVHERFKTPVLATLLSGFVGGVLAAIFNVQELADMMSIGTLLAYSLVAISVLILRTSCMDEALLISSSQFEDVEYQESIFAMLINKKRTQMPNQMTASMSLWLIFYSCISIFLMDILLVTLENRLARCDIVALSLIALTVIMFISSIILLSRQPTENKPSTFQTPWSPTVPLVSVAMNTYLMMKLSVATWIRFGIWMLIGFSLYFGYGIRNSTGSLPSGRNRSIETDETQDDTVTDGSIEQNLSIREEKEGKKEEN